MPFVVDINPDSVPVDQIPAMLSALAALQGALAARLMEPAPPVPSVVCEDPLLTVAEAARRLGYAKSRIYELVRQGDLIAMRDGKHIRIRAEVVGAFIAAHEGVDSSRHGAYRDRHEAAGRKTDSQAPRTHPGRPRRVPGRQRDDRQPLGTGHSDNH